MVEIVLSSTNTTGWNTVHRNDLPPWNSDDSVQHGARSTQPVNSTRAGIAGLNQRTYQYVETGKCAVSTGDLVLWSDSASWCTMAAFWKTGRAGLAHVVPSSKAGEDILDLMNRFGDIPMEIHLVTMPNHVGRADGFQAVKNAIRTRYGLNYANIRVYLVNGYSGREWEQKHQLGVDPRMGAYPVFNS
jgi:hypothetical protein